MIARIDSDFISYAVGAACENKYYIYKGEEWESKVALNKQLRADGVEEMEIETLTRPETWESCRASVISYTEDIISKVDCYYQLYISGHGNFRYDIATIFPYKGNRSKSDRPFHYDNIRQYLVDAYGAKVSENMEADDIIGLEHDPETDIIVTKDKDLNCIEGLHFNWETNRCFWMNEIDSYRNFYQQVLTGDTVDNIPGLYGVGNKSKLMDNLKAIDNEPEMFDLVAKQYQVRFGSYWVQFMLENCRLLWILQRREPAWRSRLEV